MGIMSFKKKIDRWEIGLAVGLILPIIAFFVFWEWKYAEKDWENLMYFMKARSDNRNSILVFTMVPNLILFYFSNFQFRIDKFTMGLVGITIALTIPIVISLVI